MTHAHERQAMADLKDLELARPGTWNLASGKITVTPQMLDDAARFAAREGGRAGYLKLGHTDTRFAAGDGEPALGWLGNIRVEEDDQGHVLMGDVTGMPDWLAAAAPTAWPDRSIEGYADYVHDGQTYGLAIDGLALLGVTPPGMSSLKSLRDLPAALGVAASGRRIVASFGGPITSAPEAVVPTNRTGAGMDPVKIREALGLDPGASDDDVKAALTTAGFVSDPPASPTSDPGLVHASGLMRVDASAWQEREDRIKRLEAQAAKAREAERDQIIGQAVQAGKFAPARKEHWVRMWNADPEGARQLIDTLATNVVPVMASGYSTDNDEDMDADYAALFPPASRGGSRG